MRNIEIIQVESEAVPALLRWVHFELSPDELYLLESEYQSRSIVAPAPRPMEAVVDGVRISGAYFTCLPGRLAMLGAVHTLPGHEQLGGLLVNTLVAQLREQYMVIQVQAAVDERNEVVQRILESAGFHSLTSVDQMWREVNGTVYSPAEQAPQPAENDQQAVPILGWTAANILSQDRFAELLEQTFQGSMDCPELNGLRHRNDVLASFLNGRRFSSISTWEVAMCRGDPVGCVMMVEHPNSVSELTYMGLIPDARRRGFSRQLIRRATELARRSGNTAVALAVDVRNEAALKVYTRCGFQFHCRLKVYLFGES